MLRFRLFILVLTLLVVAVYSPSYYADFVGYDDPAYVTENSYVNQGFTSEGTRWAFLQTGSGGQLRHAGVSNIWHPLSWMSHMVDVELFGLSSPGGHHMHNVLLHTVATLLLFLCLLKLGVEVRVAALAAALFAVHPMRVESVAWISERKDVLSGALCFATLWAYLHGWRKVSVLIFLLALMAKPSVVVLPGLLMLLSWWEGKMKVSHNWKALVADEFKDKLPWVIPAVLVAGVTVFFQYSGTQSEFVTPLGHRLLVMPASLFFYFWRTVWPFDLSFHYPLPANALVTQLAIPMLALLAFLLWRGREKMPHLLFGVLWFLIFWFPSSGIFQVGSSFTADRYTYLGHVGLFIAILLSLKKVILPGVAILSFWSVLAFWQCRVWGNDGTLFAHGIKAQPRDPVCWQNLASMHQRNGDFAEAIQLHQNALALNPREYISHYNLGLCRESLGDYGSAALGYQESLDINPGYRPAHRALGLILINPESDQNEPYKALTHLEEAYRLSAGRDQKVGEILEKLNKALEAREKDLRSR